MLMSGKKKPRTAGGLYGVTKHRKWCSIDCDSDIVAHFQQKCKGVLV